MTNFKEKMLGQKKTSPLFLLAAVFTVAIILAVLNQGYNRFVYARDALTEKDLGICLDEIDSQNYKECWEYLNETGQKDLSALWEGIPDYIVEGN